MRKLEQRTPRPSRKTRTKTYQPREERMDIDDKEAHNREVRMQLVGCDEFIDQVNGTLEFFARRLDSEGIEQLGKYHKECVAVLDTIDSDLKRFCAELKPMQDQAIAFINTTDGEAWEWTMNTHSLCEGLNLLRDQHVTLYMGNYNSLMDQVDL